MMKTLVNIKEIENEVKELNFDLNLIIEQSNNNQYIFSLEVYLNDYNDMFYLTLKVRNILEIRYSHYIEKIEFDFDKKENSNFIYFYTCQ